LTLTVSGRASAVAILRRRGQDARMNHTTPVARSVRIPDDLSTESSHT